MAQKRNSFEHSSGSGKALGLGVALLVSAFLMSNALASPGGLWMGWFTLIPLFLSIRVLTPLRALLAGSFWGLCLFLFLLLSGDASFAPTAWSLLLLCVVPATYAFLAARLAQRLAFSPLLLAVGWIGVELALQPLGLRNGLLAGTQGQGLVVRTIGYLGGFVAVAFIVAYVNAVLLAMLHDVCVVVLRSRLSSGPSGAVKRLFSIDLPAHFFQSLSLSRPRAPPLSG